MSATGQPWCQNRDQPGQQIPIYKSQAKEKEAWEIKDPKEIIEQLSQSSNTKRKTKLLKYSQNSNGGPLGFYKNQGELLGCQQHHILVKPSFTRYISWLQCMVRHIDRFLHPV